MLWLKEKDFIVENQLLCSSQSNLKDMLEYLMSTNIEEKISQDGCSIYLSEPVSKITIAKDYPDYKIIGSIYSYCYSILYGILNDSADCLIDLNKLKMPGYLSWEVIDKLVDSLNPELLYELLDNTLLELYYFSTSIMDEIKLKEIRKINISQLEEMKRQAKALGLNYLGTEFEELCEKVELAESNSKVFTLSKKINSKLNV